MLKDEIARFNSWAAELASRSAEWESEYENWSELYEAVETTISADALDSETIDLLLYVLSRDNECEVVLEMLHAKPVVGYQIGVAGLNYPDPEARWQIAVLLGHIASAPALSALATMLNDPEEYVRRRSLLAIRERVADLAENTAISWLCSPYEYSRMVALDTLKYLNSSRFSQAIDQLREDQSIVVQNWLSKQSLDQSPTGGA